MARAERLRWPLLLALAQLMDVASTWLSLRAGVPEQNPLVRAALAHGDFLLFLAVKLTLVAALLMLVGSTTSRLRANRVSWLAVQGLAIGFTAVAALNTAGVLLTVL
ncbi:MAG TPA: DUF5658 family protein [Candidatus Dormibacteraeota bacterium]|jgi:hypothetical protein